MDVFDKIEILTLSAIVKLKEKIDSCNLSPCESPIERLMRAAFYAKQIEESHWITTKFMDSGSIDFDFLENMRKCDFKPWEVLVWPQVKIGQYRVDFVAQTCVSYGNISPKLEYLAVECDGHEFHEKTKLQATRDKARDRYLVGKQIPVMRFTGSEIWEDPMECAGQIVAYFEEKHMPSTMTAEQ